MTDRDKLYEEYLHRDDLIVEKDGKTYYRIAWSYLIKLNAAKKEILAICPCPDMPRGEEYLYEDENGNHFVFGGYHHYNFIKVAPKWYMRSGECGMEWKETKEIGQYLTVLKA